MFFEKLTDKEKKLFNLSLVYEDLGGAYFPGHGLISLVAKIGAFLKDAEVAIGEQAKKIRILEGMNEIQAIRIIDLLEEHAESTRVGEIKQQLQDAQVNMQTMKQMYLAEKRKAIDLQDQNNTIYSTIREMELALSRAYTSQDMAEQDVHEMQSQREAALKHIVYLESKIKELTEALNARKRN